MTHQFPVTVLDDKGAAIAGAQVCLVKRSALGSARFPYPAIAATHDDKGAGRYEPKAEIVPTAEAWILLVRLAGKSPVAQPLKVTARAAGGFDVLPSPVTAATVTFTTTTRTVGASKVQETAFAITMHPAAELVYLGGLDYNARDPSKGWLFHEYGFGRAQVLWRKKQIHPGTIVTVFSTAKITVTTRVKAQGDWRKWLDIDVFKLGDLSTRVLPAADKLYEPVVGLDIHITDFYKYLDGVGTREPHSVREVGIFSHSFPGGPILYDTGEDDAHRVAAARQASDFDARAKDFNATNFAGYPRMADALAPDCRFNVWGCSATRLFKFRTVKALQQVRAGRPEDEFFVVSVDIRDHDSKLIQLVEERTSELRHRHDMDLRFRKGTYIAAAAAKLGVSCRSACPGCSSDPKPDDGIEMLGVDLATYGEVYAYFRAKFSPDFDFTNERWDHGYIDYHALQARAPVAQPPFSSEYYGLTQDFRLAQASAPNAFTLQFANRKTITDANVNLKLASKAVKDFGGVAGTHGHLYTLTDSDPAKSRAVYVQSDGKLFTVTRDAKHAFTVLGAELP